MRMNVAQADFFEPRDGLAILLLLIVKLAELIARVREMRIESRGLSEIFFLLLGGVGEQAADIILFGIDADGRAQRAELGFGREPWWARSE